VTEFLEKPPRVSLLALPESAGSVLYGLYDVFAMAGHLWTDITGEPESSAGFSVEIVSPSSQLFRCFGGVPVAPHATLAERPASDLVLIPDFAIATDFDPAGCWPEAVAWVRGQHAAGATVASVCSGAVLLAAAGLLDGLRATTHWAYEDLFRRHFPQVTLCLNEVLVPAGPAGRIVTSGGATSWEDLALHLIGRFCGKVEARRVAKVFLIGDRSEGQLCYAAWARPRRHDDRVIGDCQEWIADHYAAPNPVTRMVERSGLPERSFKRRFRAATGYTTVAYVQALRIEEAKQQLETTDWPTDQVAAAVGYEDPAFFRRLFKRHTGVTPARYRQRYRGIGRTLAAAGE